MRGAGGGTYGDAEEELLVRVAEDVRAARVGLLVGDDRLKGVLLRLVQTRQLREVKVLEQRNLP